MGDNFVPLFPRSNGSVPTAPRVHRNAGPAKADSFQPLAATPAAGHPCGPVREPRMTLEREGARVTKIRIECSCGQIIELACEY